MPQYLSKQKQYARDYKRKYRILWAHSTGDRAAFGHYCSVLLPGLNKGHTTRMFNFRNKQLIEAERHPTTEEEATALLSSMCLDKIDTCIDYGSGTGNIKKCVKRIHPHLKVTNVDCDACVKPDIVADATDPSTMHEVRKSDCAVFRCAHLKAYGKQYKLASEFGSILHQSSGPA